MTSTGIAEALGGRLPPECIVQDSIDRYAVDGVLPAAVIRPASTDEVGAVLRFATELGLAVIPWGHGLHMDLGNRPRRYDLAVDLSGLDAISDYSPADLVVTAQAGVTLGALNRRL